MTHGNQAHQGVCTYCGKVAPVTADHVIPKNLFPRPYPPNMWTVPSCRRCNGGFSKDDEYFRLVLTIAEKAKGHRARDALLPTAIRGLNKPAAMRLRRSILNKVSVRPRFSASGLYLGQQRAIEFDGKRIDRTGGRIVRGLFFRVKGHRLPDDHRVNVLHVRRFPGAAAIHPELDLTLRQFIALLYEEPAHKLGDTFAFRWVQSPNSPDHTMWLLEFYGHLEFYCTTYSLASIENTTLEAEIAKVQALERSITV